MNNSNFNQNEELENIKSGSVKELVDEPIALDQTTEAEEPAKQQPVRRSAHMTASAAAMNVEGEEVDIRRMQPKKEVAIKKSRISYERKKSLYVNTI